MFDLEKVFAPLDEAMKPIHEYNEKLKEFNKKPMHTGLEPEEKERKYGRKN